MPQYFDSTAAFPRKSKKRKGYYGGGRTNLLEELGRVEAEPSNRNRRAEISRVHGELNRGYKTGGRVGLKHGGRIGAKGGGIAKRGTGAAFKSGGRVKSMGIAKRGGGVAKR